ncbi:hypothetical protein IFM46972_11295 [Aspergillus udagawae]|uniref:Uncharacterized protein n=1 Tax=Aspergillus udagawae TaxID=91492 RepID=A0A8H3SFQ3_9EURO|nr:hypothetical protein IFM46972_11295 [Aspergillus udagawae]
MAAGRSPIVRLQCTVELSATLKLNGAGKEEERTAPYRKGAVHWERGRQQEKEEETVRRLYIDGAGGMEAAGDGRKSGENTGAIPKTDALGRMGQARWKAADGRFHEGRFQRPANRVIEY